MTNEKDKIAARKLIESIFANRGWSNGELTEAVTAFAATVRTEEREAAFSDFTAIVKQYIGACPGDAQLQLYAALKTATESHAGWLSPGFWNTRLSPASAAPVVDEQRGEPMPEAEIQAAISASKERLHWPFTAKHDNCAKCAREYEAPPAAATAAPVEQSDAAKLAAAEIAQLEKPNHTAEAVATQDCDICNTYRQKIAAIIRRHYEGAR